MYTESIPWVQALHAKEERLVTTLVPSFLILSAHLTSFLLFYAHWVPVSYQLCYHLCTTGNLKKHIFILGSFSSSKPQRKAFSHPSYLKHELSSYWSTNIDLFSPVHGSSGFPVLLLFWGYSEIYLPSCAPETGHHNSSTKNKRISRWGFFSYRS